MFKFTVPLVLVAALAGTAHAQEISVPVDYSDLDLTSASGVARLDDRIDSAVDQVCGETLGQKSLSERLAIRSCVRDARVSVRDPRRFAIDRANGKLPMRADARSALVLTAARHAR